MKKNYFPFVQVFFNVYENIFPILTYGSYFKYYYGVIPTTNSALSLSSRKKL